MQPISGWSAIVCSTEVRKSRLSYVSFSLRPALQNYACGSAVSSAGADSSCNTTGRKRHPPLSTNSHSSSPLNARTQPSSPAAECTNAIDTSCTAPAQVLPPRQKSPARFQTHRAAEAKGSSNPCTSSRSVHQNLALKANLRLLPLRGACRFLPCRTEGSTSPHFSVARLR